MSSRDKAIEAINCKVSAIAQLPEPEARDPMIAAIASYARMCSPKGRWMLMGAAKIYAVTEPLQTESAQVLKFPAKNKRRSKR